MRKHDEGYALPFVLVVFLVFSLIATSVLTVSLNNLKKQKASIQRTQDQYAAQGEIEKVVAKWENATQVEITSNTLRADFSGSAEYIKVDNTVQVTLIAMHGSVAIECRVVLSSSGVTEGTATDAVTNDAVKSYILTQPTITYESYTVSTVEPIFQNGGGD